MKIKVIGRFQSITITSEPTIFLSWDDWNDYSYNTLFGVSFVDEFGNDHHIGSVKIAYIGQGENERNLAIGDNLDKLDSQTFSLGQSDSYYVKLNNLGKDTRDSFLEAMNDIAKNEELYSKVINEQVTRVSLLRTISPTTVTGQFRRLSSGGVRLTEYNFKFIAPKIKRDSSNFQLKFKVNPESYPPSNIHVLIGRNGVGKTHLTNNMISSLLNNNHDENWGFTFDDNNETEFANLISVSFSAFDETEPRREIKDKTKGLQYSYIGLKREKIGKEKHAGTKSTTKLKNEFFNSLNHCRTTHKERWKNIIEMLESDPNFKQADIKAIIDIKDDLTFRQKAKNVFELLSSGHKIVLLTVTRLVESLQEKSLVLIDEPEAHLHPPLLSAFIRALSELLVRVNGVAIIATHSPVILQEVPKKCVWKLRRIGAEAVSERLQSETFGENVGILTNEVFRLEVMNAGFYKLIEEVASKYDSYDEVLNHFEGQLGMEARAILMTYFAE